MNIIYISSTCSREKYSEYVESKGARVSQQAQKYNLLLAEGLVSAGADINLISTRPINRTVERRLWFKSEKEDVNGIKFNYVHFVNLPIFRNLSILLSVFFRVLFSPAKRRESAVVCDALNISATAAAVMASAIRGYKTVGIVTDVPGHWSLSKKVSFNQKLNLFIMRRFKSYLLLTEPMSEIVNPKNRPYIVMEGHSDMSMANVENHLENKFEKKVCLYAGSLMKIYGIENLVEGFVKANIPNSELRIYGNGDYVERLCELAKKYENVKYLGIAPNSVIVEEELKATLLVNPRPTNEEYTKYSFPSKNMEYMASGTPLLTTKLPGMPKEYNDYVYLLEDESAEGVSRVLSEVLTENVEELHCKGEKAKVFVLREKNNKKQAEKLLRMINEAF